MRPAWAGMTRADDPGTMSHPSLHEVRRASRCGAEWATMEGDQGVRLCRKCNRCLYDFEALDPADIHRFFGVASHHKPLYRRDDGKFMTVDCPVGKRQRFRAAVAGLAVMIGGMLAWLLELASVASPDRLSGGAHVGGNSRPTETRTR
jgi:hypothetical protein